MAGTYRGLARVGFVLLAWGWVWVQRSKQYHHGQIPFQYRRRQRQEEQQHQQKGGQEGTTERCKEFLAGRHGRHGIHEEEECTRQQQDGFVEEHSC